MTEPTQPANTGKIGRYLVAIVVMSLIGVVGVLTLELLRPEKDNTVLISMILSSLAPTTLSLLALMKSDETHSLVNHKLDEWKKTFMQGEKAGIEASTGMKMVSRTQGPLEADSPSPPVPPSVGFKITSIFMRM